MMLAVMQQLRQGVTRLLRAREVDAAVPIPPHLATLATEDVMVHHLDDPRLW